MLTKEQIQVIIDNLKAIKSMTTYLGMHPGKEMLRLGVADRDMKEVLALSKMDIDFDIFLSALTPETIKKDGNELLKKAQKGMKEQDWARLDHWVDKYLVVNILHPTMKLGEKLSQLAGALNHHSRVAGFRFNMSHAWASQQMQERGLLPA